MQLYEVVWQKLIKMATTQRQILILFAICINFQHTHVLNQQLYAYLICEICLRLYI
jgi:hypothetical protein